MTCAKCKGTGTLILSLTSNNHVHLCPRCKHSWIRYAQDLPVRNAAVTLAAFRRWQEGRTC